MTELLDIILASITPIIIAIFGYYTSRMEKRTAKAKEAEKKEIFAKLEEIDKNFNMKLNDLSNELGKVVIVSKLSLDFSTSISQSLQVVGTKYLVDGELKTAIVEVEISKLKELEKQIISEMHKALY